LSNGDGTILKQLWALASFDLVNVKKTLPMCQKNPKVVPIFVLEVPYPFHVPKCFQFSHA
jgi:hypothetical protein